MALEQTTAEYGDCAKRKAVAEEEEIRKQEEEEKRKKAKKKLVNQRYYQTVTKPKLEAKKKEAEAKKKEAEAKKAASVEAKKKEESAADAGAAVGGKGRVSVVIDFKRTDNSAVDNIVVQFSRCQKETLYDLLTSSTSELDKEMLLDIPRDKAGRDVTLVITLGDNHQNGRKLSTRTLTKWTIEYIVDNYLALPVEPSSHITAWISFEEEVKRRGNIWSPPLEQTEQG